MVTPGEIAGNSASNAIDLTDDSNNVSECGIQEVSPVNPVIKQEPAEEKGPIVDPDAAADPNDVRPVQPDTEHIEAEHAQVENELPRITHDDAQEEQVENILEASSKALSGLPKGVEQSSNTKDETDQPQEDAIDVQSSNDGYNLNLVDLFSSASAEHHEEQNSGSPAVGQDAFGTNNATESLENINFEPLPDFDTSADQDVDMNGFAALMQFNQNKPDFGDEDVVNDVLEDADGDYGFVDHNPAEATAEPLGTLIDEHGEEMDWNTVLEENNAAAEELAAAAFAQREQEYERKKAAGTNTPEDDICFTSEVADEQRRLRDIERSQLEVEDPPEQTGLPAGYVEEDSLFVSEVPTFSEPPPKKRAAPKSRNRLSKKDVDDALSAGLTAGRGETRKPKRKASASNGDPQPRKKRETKKAGGVRKPAQKRGGKPNMTNLASLGRTNIIEAAQANASRPDMPTFSERNKAKALKELIASIPSAERANVGSDRNAVMEATKKFKGIGAMRADGHGGWRLRGMSSSLYNHQLLGTAFLRERETGDAKPKGGMVCDEMGFGKTIQMIANMVDGKAQEGSAVKTTLIIAPPSLLQQWMEEMQKHVDRKFLGRILRYHTGSRLQSNDVLADLKEYDVILTTYSEIQRSYPLCDPPKHLASEARKNEWWKKYYQDKVGPLHRIKWHRIVLDEAHNIKNHTSKTSIAVRALTGNFKWCITGTPILNYIEELFPYFSFLKVPHTGDYATFCHNYCNNRGNSREPIKMARIHNILKVVMLRRTHEDTLFNAPIVKLPGISHQTVLVELNPVERSIYNMVKAKYIQSINSFSKSGSLLANYHNVLAMLLRLRMLCSHLMLIQNVLKQMLNAADVEALWRLTAKEVLPSDDAKQLNMIQTLRMMLAKNENTLLTTQTKQAEPTAAMTPDNQDEENMQTGSSFGLYFKFRKFLRVLSQSDTWAELHLRSICAKCKAPPDNPVCTSCFHVYCQECMNAMHEDRKAKGEEEQTTCLECQTQFTETTPCSGLKELGFGGAEVMPKVQKKLDKRKRQQDRAKKAAARTKRGGSSRRGSLASEISDDESEEEYDDWIENGGHMLPSAKLAATKAAILNWREKHPTQKIIVYTQFLDLGRILSKVCNEEGWGHVRFNGKMSIDARGKAIEQFRDDPDTFIMICSLKAGGVGLNLTMASKVIILDLWFNSSIEAQAYCRAFRIGQENCVDVLRFVVKDSIDEDLIKMQERKDVEVVGAIGNGILGKRATVKQLLELFGEVREEGENEFILVEEDEEDKDRDVDVADRLPPRPF